MTGIILAHLVNVCVGEVTHFILVTGGDKFRELMKKSLYNLPSTK